jgi:hypothetical protein
LVSPELPGARKNLLVLWIAVFARIALHLSAFGEVLSYFLVGFVAETVFGNAKLALAVVGRPILLVLRDEPHVF